MKEKPTHYKRNLDMLNWCLGWEKSRKKCIDGREKDKYNSEKYSWFQLVHIHTHTHITSYNIHKVNHHFENPVTEMIKMMWMLVSDVSATTSVWCFMDRFGYLLWIPTINNNMPAGGYFRASDKNRYYLNTMNKSSKPKASYCPWEA